MSITIYELQDRLKEVDELSLMEMLDISSEEIVDKFIDKIENKFTTLVTSFEEPDEDNETLHR